MSNLGRAQTAEHVAKRSASQIANLAKAPRVCVVCSEAFFRTAAAQRYCAGECWNQVARQKRAKLDRVSTTPAQYQAIAARFGDGCGICGAASAAAKGGKLAVDHCHTTGEIRGLLCHPCNTTLGLMKDDADRLIAAAIYIETAKRVSGAYTLSIKERFETCNS